MKEYKVSSYPLASDLDLQRLLKHLSNDGGPHTITHVIIDMSRPPERQMIIVRLPD